MLHSKICENLENPILSATPDFLSSSKLIFTLIPQLFAPMTCQNIQIYNCFVTTSCNVNYNPFFRQLSLSEASWNFAFMAHRQFSLCFICSRFSPRTYLRPLVPGRSGSTEHLEAIRFQTQVPIKSEICCAVKKLTEKSLELLTSHK